MCYWAWCKTRLLSVTSAIFLYAEVMMSEALEGTEEGIVVGGNLLKDI